MRSLARALVVVALLIPGSGAGGQEKPRLDEPIQPHPEGQAAIDRLLSPYCPGFMLEVCPSPQAKLLRDTLLLMAHEGASADSLVNWMLSSFGEEYRAVPQARGSGLWAWIMPPFALLGGLLLVVFVLRHFRSGAQAEAGAQPGGEPLSKEDAAALEAALEELKESEEVPF